MTGRICGTGSCVPSFAMDNNDSVANVLNTLAGKLTYSNFTKGEKSLTGYVKIADGLTASSKAKYTADITFNESGKGTYDKAASVMPDHQVKTEFTTTPASAPRNRISTDSLLHLRRWVHRSATSSQTRNPVRISTVQGIKR